MHAYTHNNKKEGLSAFFNDLKTHSLIN